jgi:uncharacterized protein YegL
MHEMGFQDPGGGEARQRLVRAALFAGALALSLAFHGLLLARLPAFPAGRPADLYRAPSRPLAMGDVRTEPAPPRFVQPEAFRPENPEAFADVEPLQRRLLEELRAGAEAIDFVPPAPAEADAPMPEVAPSAMDFRQEILQIDRRLAAAELEALPRRIVPAAPRIDGAPDVTLPADPGAVAAAASAGVRADAGVRPLSVLAAAVPDPVAMLEASGGGEQPLPERIREQARALDETPADVTDLEPIERLLALDVSAFRASDENAVYFEFSISRAGEEALPVLPKDVLLIQDCSESMTRSKLDYFKSGLVDYLRTLTTVDRVNVMRYSDSPTLCFDEWTPVTAESLGEVARFVEAMRARGQTDLFTPLQKVLQHHPPTGRPILAVLMTDGRPTMGAVDSSDIIARFSRANDGRISVFTVGAGDRVNVFLLDLLGHNNRGGSWILPLREQIPDAVRRAARELSRPVLADLEYRVSGELGAEVYPRTLAHLYLDRPLRLVGRAPMNASSAMLQIVGTSGPHRRDMVFAVDLAAAPNGGEGIRREWVAQKIYKLINDHIAAGRSDLVREIRALSLRHNVPLPYGADFPLQ